MGMEGRNSWALNSAWRPSLWPPASLASPCCSDWHPINTQIIDRNSLGLDFILASEGMNPGAADSSLLTICLNAHEPQYQMLLKPPWSKAYNWYTSSSAYLSSSVKQRQQKYFPLPVLICKTIKIEINDRINNMMLSFQKFSEIGSVPVLWTNKPSHAGSWTLSTGGQMLTEVIILKSKVHTASVCFEDRGHSASYITTDITATLLMEDVKSVPKNCEILEKIMKYFMADKILKETKDQCRNKAVG